MEKPGKYEYMAIIREIEKLYEITDPIKLQEQENIVKNLQTKYEFSGLYEQMVKDDEIKRMK